VAAERFLRGEVGVERAEVLDIDEEAFRRDELRLRLYGTALVPAADEVVRSGKEVASYAEEELEAIASYVVENMEPGVLYILGPGSTVAAIARRLGISKTLLGFDAVIDGRLVGRDLNEAGMLELLKRYPKAKVIVSPIGGQGFLLGRGNQQLSPEVIRRVGVDNIVVVAAKSKALRLRSLRVDTGDPELDSALRGFRRVIIGYGEELVLRVICGQEAVAGDGAYAIRLGRTARGGRPSLADGIGLQRRGGPGRGFLPGPLYSATPGGPAPATDPSFVGLGIKGVRPSPEGQL